MVVEIEDLGEATIEPSEAAEVGSWGTWAVTLTVGRYGMDDGASFLIAQRDMTDAGPLQCVSPDGPGYVSASTDGEARIEVGYDPWRWIRPFRGALSVRIYDGSLRPGEHVTVVLGDTSHGSPGWRLQTFPERKHEFRVLVDPFGTRLFRPIATHPAIRIIPSKPASLDAVIPSLARPGEHIQIWIRALDGYGNPVEDFQGNVALSEIPEGGRVVRIRRGVCRAGEINFPGVGPHRIGLTCGELVGWSNPILVTSADRRILWADLHGQTEDAIGTGSVEEYFSYARGKALVKVTSWQGNDFQVTDEAWREVCARTKEFNDPGTFVTLLGYEWSGPTPLGGDYNILYLGDDQPIHRSSLWQVSDPGEAWTPISRLWGELGDREDVLAVAHVGGRYANLDFWDPRFCGLIEVHSGHGTFEWLVEEALRRGLLFGVVAGSDDHSGRPGWSPPLSRGGVRGTVRLDAFGGLTAIYADQPTRPEIWEALRSRHCYGTTGQRIVLDVRSGNGMMGDLLDPEEAREISVSVLGTSPLLDIDVRRDDGRTYRHLIDQDREAGWIRVEWSGLRVKSRNRRVKWEARLKVAGGGIREFVPFGFWREGDGVRRQSDRELSIMCTTVGNSMGAFIRISGRGPRICFHSSQGSRKISGSKLGRDPTVFKMGGVNMKLSLSRSNPHDRPEAAEFRYEDPEGSGKEHAYWVKVSQMDGHGAWSSPLFFRQPR